jgi:CRISPR/Cas system-associated exonuclease Cas4 (RecB family)
METRTSHSKCEVFNDCPLQGYFKYIAKVDPEPKFRDTAFIGSYTHNSIESWFLMYNEVDIKGIAYPHEHFDNTMTDIYNQGSDTIPTPEDEEAIILCMDSFIDFMTRRLNYVKSHDMVDSFLPILVEKEYNKEINGVPLHGFLDAGFQDKQLWLIDWKTSKDPKITDKFIRQATRYALLTDGEFDQPINDFFMVNLRSRVDLSKSRILITEQMKQKQREELAGVWALMNGTYFPKPEKKKNCYFCEYKLRCAAYPSDGVTINPDDVAVVESLYPNDTIESIQEAVIVEDVQEVYITKPVDLESVDAWL